MTRTTESAADTLPRDANANERPFAVYVAASSSPSEAARVAAAIASLRAHGFHVTCTWVTVVAKVGDANPRAASQADRRGWSVQCLAEIDESDALWFMYPRPPATTVGGVWETSHAHDVGKHVVISGETTRSVFCALGTEFETDEGALAFLRELRDRERTRSDAGLDVGGES